MQQLEECVTDLVWQSFGDCLKHWRGVRKLSQAALSDQMGFHSSYLSKIESNKSPVTADFANRAEHVLNAEGALVELYRQEFASTEAGSSGPQFGTGIGLVDRLLSLEIVVDDDGWATLAYEHQVTNTGPKTVSGFPREVWFETTQGKIDIRVLAAHDPARKIMIERTHETAYMVKYFCRFLPALGVGESATVRYVCSGGRFVYDHYWRQSIMRPTSKLQIRLRHSGIRSLMRCDATEECTDGSTSSAAEGLFWNEDETGVTIGLGRTDLASGQAVTLRWGPEDD
jgi:transcriptional regulator with XRE-family HTH domain